MDAAGAGDLNLIIFLLIRYGRLVIFRIARTVLEIIDYFPYPAAILAGHGGAF